MARGAEQVGGEEFNLEFTRVEFGYESEEPT